ncbi:hypothetical protein J1614_009099 [Plenodomus biglobosus]|nr:hypothetical protein J1614_009099 [Plenodomus biglobosus]
MAMPRLPFAWRRLFLHASRTPHELAYSSKICMYRSLTAAVGINVRQPQSTPHWRVSAVSISTAVPQASAKVTKAASTVHPRTLFRGSFRRGAFAARNHCLQPDSAAALDPAAVHEATLVTQDIFGRSDAAVPASPDRTRAWLVAALHAAPFHSIRTVIQTARPWPNGLAASHHSLPYFPHGYIPHIRTRRTPLMAYKLALTRTGWTKPCG